jgi:Arc/MetJ family transcription regulator
LVSGQAGRPRPCPVSVAVDLDEEALGAARAELGTTTIKDTVNEALRLAGADRLGSVRHAFDVLAGADLDDDREDAWR